MLCVTQMLALRSSLLVAYPRNLSGVIPYHNRMKFTCDASMSGFLEHVSNGRPKLGLSIVKHPGGVSYRAARRSSPRPWPHCAVHAGRTERADDELLISGGSSHLVSAGALLASMAQEHVSRPLTTQ